MAPRIWTGIAAPIAAVSALLLTSAVGTAWYVRHMQATTARVLAENVNSMRAAQELELSVRDLRSQGVRYLLTGNPKLLEPIPRQRERVADALTHAESLATTPAEQALMRRTRAGLVAFSTEYDRMTAGRPDQADYARTLELVDTTLATEVIEPTREYLRLNEGGLARANEENERVATYLTTGLVVLGLCGSVGGLLGGWVIAAGLRRTMMRTEERLRTTARQLDEAARTAEDNAHRAGKSADALDDVARSATAVLDRLRQTERDALRAEQLAWAGRMAAGIAHEVRNPLMAIKLLIQALADGRTGDRLRPRDMEVLEEESIRLEQAVGTFLDFARPPRPDKKPVEVGPLVEQVAGRVRGRADLQRVAVEVDVPRKPVVAELDPNQLQQVLYNLLFNALDARPTGGWIGVSVASAGDRVEVAVEDDGPGLPSQVRKRLFEPFVGTKEAGMGLGLSICRRIVESHAGEIAAEDRAGGGTRFVVRLPVTAAEPRPEPAAARA
jgi:two-component system, NtrC family, sensor histidine kinase HydH